MIQLICFLIFCDWCKLTNCNWPMVTVSIWIALRASQVPQLTRGSGNLTNCKPTTDTCNSLITLLCFLHLYVDKYQKYIIIITIVVSTIISITIIRGGEWTSTIRNQKQTLNLNIKWTLISIAAQEHCSVLVLNWKKRIFILYRSCYRSTV